MRPPIRSWAECGSPHGCSPPTWRLDEFEFEFATLLTGGAVGFQKPRVERSSVVPDPCLSMTRSCLRVLPMGASFVVHDPKHLFSWYGSKNFAFCRPPAKMNRTKKLKNQKHAKNSEEHMGVQLLPPTFMASGPAKFHGPGSSRSFRKPGRDQLVKNTLSDQRNSTNLSLGARKKEKTTAQPFTWQGFLDASRRTSQLPALASGECLVAPKSESDSSGRWLEIGCGVT